jgi:hypothetical protein
MVEMENDPSPQEASKSRKPLLKDIEAQVENEEEEATRNKRETKKTLYTRIIQGAAIAAVVLNLLAIIFEQSAIMIIAGVFGIAIGGGVIYFQEELRTEDCK